MAALQHAAHVATLCALGGLAVADAAQPANLRGEPFPVVETLVIGLVAFAFAAVVAVLAAWKSAQIESAFAAVFERIGRCIVTHPVKFIAGSLFVVVACGYGFALQESEIDPARLWVPRGSASIEHSEYVKKTWPSSARPNFFFAVPEGGNIGENMLTPAKLQALYRDFEALLEVRVDGAAIIDANEGKKRDEAAPFAGTWTFDGRSGTQKKCFEFGSQCGFLSVLWVFGFDATTVASLTPAIIKDRLAQWESAAKNTLMPGLGVYKSFELTEVLGGIGRDGSGKIVSAEVIRTVMFMQVNEVKVKYYKDGDEKMYDPVNMVWEAEALCQMGVEEKHRFKKGTSCQRPPGLRHVGYLSRSFSDEFGDAIGSDVTRIAIAYLLIVVYLCLNLGKRDKVHSMIAMSVGCLLVIGLSYALSNCLGAFFHVKVNPLNNQIPFLLLGLGVDDAFVITAEFMRRSASGALSAEERVAGAVKSAGLSILITSLTDALAFFIGATTRLPALSAFCTYAGFGITACFIFMLTFFAPLLVLNARRADANRFDVLCCFKSKVEHKLSEPQGCCSCIPACARVQPKEAKMPRVFRAFGEVVVKSLPGRLATFTVFAALLVSGIVGVTQLEKDWKIEWFFPEDSYIQDYFDMNDRYFSIGTDFTVYTNGVDFFAKQAAMRELNEYITIQNFIIDGTTDDWFAEFTNGSSPVTDKVQFWNNFWQWSKTTGARHQGSIQWRNPACDAPLASPCTAAQKQEGIAHARPITSTLKAFETGSKRYEVIRTMREDVNNMFGDSSGQAVFPYTRAFLTWEEVGIIDAELFRNLLIASAVICVVLAVMIPQPRIAGIVALNIIAAVVEVIGLSHFWDLKMNGVSTIYYLICTGLAVDYSAHIGQSFKESSGSSEERSLRALTNIGPSVWNAIFSNLLAVAVLSMSKSFVFEVFFRILFLVSVVAGAHGLWLLPVLLSVFGGSSEGPADPVQVLDGKEAQDSPEPADALGG